MRPTNGNQHYNITLSLIGSVHIHNDLYNTASSTAITTEEYRDQTHNTYLISRSSQAAACCLGSHLIYLSKHDRKQEEIVVSLERYIANQTQTPIKPLLLHHDLLFWL